jgi:hypothetical protein
VGSGDGCLSIEGGERTPRGVAGAAVSSRFSRPASTAATVAATRACSAASGTATSVSGPAAASTSASASASASAPGSSAMDHPRAAPPPAARASLRGVSGAKRVRPMPRSPPTAGDGSGAGGGGCGV